MGITFGGLQCCDPRVTLQECRRQKLPTDWWGLPNRFMSPGGRHAGRGWLLMRFADIGALNINALNPLVFGDAYSLTIQNLVFVRARCLTPGYATDPLATYLVDVRDTRYLCHNEFYGNVTNDYYNVRIPSGSQTYYQDSLNGGSPWTWQTMLNDIWNNWVSVIEIGTAPTLPFTPDGTPENYILYGLPAWDAYNDILARLGCMLSPNLDGTYEIVRIGNTSTALATAQQTYRNSLHLDDYTIESVRAKTPTFARVFFNRFELNYGSEETTPASNNWIGQPLHQVIVNNAGVPFGTESNSCVCLTDDLALQINFDGSIANNAAIASRATERANDYFRMAGGAIMRQTYNGIILDPGFEPNEQVSGVCWREGGGGYFTEIVFYPPPLTPAPNDKGEWQQDKGIGRLKFPDLGRPGLPLYPQAVNIVTITNTTTTANVYDGTVERINPTNSALSTIEPCWILAPNVGSQQKLPSSFQYEGRITGLGTYTSSAGGSQPQQRPVYFISAGNGTTTCPGIFALASGYATGLNPLVPQVFGHDGNGNCVCINTKSC